jgi:hypothetical protein
MVLHMKYNASISDIYITKTGIVLHVYYYILHHSDLLAM